MAEVEELLDSRKWTRGVNPSAEFRYGVYGVIFDDNAELNAHIAVQAASPTSFDGMNRLDIRLDKTHAEGHYEFVVDYGLLAGLDTDGNTYSLTTRGGRKRVFTSLQTVASYAVSGTPTDHKGAINVSENGVEGVDVPDPVYNFQIGRRVAFGDMTPALKAAIRGLVGSVNHAAYTVEGDTFQKGELMYLGGDINQGGSGQAFDVQHEFVAIPNKTGLSIGDMTGINAEGHFYTWAQFAEEVDATSGQIANRPIAAYVERLTDYADFSVLGL